jgi:DNA repair protein RecO (recombination protein O)
MYYQLNGLVLNVRVCGEADKSATIYTREWGKLSALVPGAKKIKAKLGAATEPVVEGEYMVYMAGPQARAKITGAKITSGFMPLRTDWRRFAVASACSEVTDLLTPYNLENSQKYDLLSRTWKLLETARHPWRIYTAFTLRFLRLSGYSFVEYIRRENTAPAVDKHEFEAIRKFSTLSGEEVDNETGISEALEARVGRHLDRYLSIYIQRPLLTKIFWQKANSK